MCGIAGLWDRRGISADALRVRSAAAIDALAHRGPDGTDVWVDAAAGVGIAHRRLAVIDLSPTGFQPMLSHCERYVITYNGELYNAPEIKRELEATGELFRGTSDTEVLLQAIVRWGLEAALQRFVGMFAFALWDQKERALSLVRDRVGKKPLFWYRAGDLIVFGSEMKALLSHPEMRRDLNRSAVASYLRLAYVPSPFGIFENVEKVAPASIVRFDPSGRIERKLYWDLAAIAEKGLRAPRAIGLAAAVDETDALLRDAAIKRTLSDVPLGMFLSGGVDSSLVAAVLQAQLTKPIRTFSIGFDDERYDESGHARLVAQSLGTDHTEMTVTAQDALDTVPALAEWFDEPFADSSQIPTHLLSALARKHVTVALSGDGGDEIGAGYVRHGAISHWWPRVERIPMVLRHAASQGITALPLGAFDALGRLLPRSVRPNHLDDKAYKFATLLDANDAGAVYRSLISQWPHPDALLGAPELPHPSTDPSIGARMSDLTGRFQYLDMASYLPDDVLCKVDRASMAVALEVRSPLLDHRVIEHFWSLPRELLRNGNERKIILREILSRYVPRPLFERPKMGFGVPIEQWLRGPLRDWAESLIGETRLRREGLFDSRPIRQAWGEHLSGRANHQYRLWTILMFQSWRQMWLDNAAPALPERRAAEPAPLH